MLNRPRLLIANPDVGICHLLRRYYRAVGYAIVTLSTGRAALEHCRANQVDLVILSADMADLGGAELIRRVRAATTAPLLVLTSQQAAIVAKEILDSGADDCIAEPFLMEELAARARRLLARSRSRYRISMEAGGLGLLEIDPLTRTVRLQGTLVPLTRREFDLLAELAAAQGHTLSHEDIVQKVWGGDEDGGVQNLRRLVQSLRRKIEPVPERPAYILSVRGSGYRLAGQPASSASDMAGTASR